ncbi:MAG: hypothetical protein KF811_04835 [Dokdonella sp.]|nr:hypothetical protein [Dokdonella sp.]
MNRFRRHRLQSRLALLAGLMLLWSQFALVLHPTASLASLASGHADYSHVTALAGCHEAPPTDLSPICKMHCSQGDQGDTSSRVPSLPFVPTASFIACLSTASEAPALGLSVAPAPALSWHRPTLHPASLLLI